METAPHIMPDEYQAFTCRTALYPEREDPLVIAEQGYKDEAVELIEQAFGDDYWTARGPLVERALSAYDWKGELGDMLWYIAQILQLRGEALSNYTTQDQWHTKQTDIPCLRELVSNAAWQEENPTMLDYTIDTRPVECIVMLSARVVDELHAWYPVYHKDSDVGAAIKEALLGIAAVGNANGFSLAEIAEHNIEKLSARKRKPHTITHITEKQPSLLDQKRKLWLGSLLGHSE